MGCRIATVTSVTTPVTKTVGMVRPGSAAWRVPGRFLHLLTPHSLYCAPAGTRSQLGLRRRVVDHVEVDLAVGDAALLGDRPEAIEHRACDHQVGHDELGPLGREGRTAGARHDVCTRRLADLRVDLDQVAIDAVPVAATDELDVAVRLVVAAADERHVRKTGDVPVDERPRRVVVDREEHDVPFADDEPDVVGAHVPGDGLDPKPPPRNTWAKASALFVPRASSGKSCRDRFEILVSVHRRRARGAGAASGGTRGTARAKGTSWLPMPPSPMSTTRSAIDATPFRPDPEIGASEKLRWSPSWEARPSARASATSRSTRLTRWAPRPGSGTGTPVDQDRRPSSFDGRGGGRSFTR